MNDPLHIVFINEFFHPDVCASSAVLTDHLPKIRALRPDWRITVITGNRAWDDPNRTWTAHETWNGIEIIRVNRRTIGSGLVRRAAGFLSFHLGVGSAGRKLPRPDVIVSSTAPPLGGRLGAALAQRFDCRHIYKVLDLYPDCATALGVLRSGGFLARQWERMDARLMRHADAVVAISDGIATRIRARPGIQVDRVRFIADGFDPQRVTPMASEQSTFRTECGLTGKFVVQYAGNMGLSHPFETILAVAERYASESAVVFQFIGHGPGRAVLEAAQQRLGNTIQVHDYQPAERLSDVLACSDVSLISQAGGMSQMSLPYKYYGILAAGRPSIFIGPVESPIIADYRTHECGYHFNQGDAAGLHDAIETLRRDAALRTVMGQHARRLFDDRYSSQKSTVQWCGLIESVVAEASQA